MRIAVLGAGTTGSLHAEAYAAMPGVELRAIYAPSGRRAGPLASRLGTTATGDLTRLLADPALDAVDVCLPSAAHPEAVVAALQAGKHVFCETPAALTLEAGQAMRAAARAAGRLLQVALLCRAIGAYAFIRASVRRGDIGRPVAAAAYRLGAYLRPGAPDFRPHYGDPTTELMPFDLDVLNWLFGAPDRVHATAARDADGRPVHVAASLAYGPVAASVEAGGVMPSSYPFTIGLRVVGERGALDLRTRFGPDGEPEETIWRYPAAGEPAPAAYPGQDPFAAECRRFVACARGEADPELLDIDRALEALRVSVAVQRSLARREAVAL